MNWTEHKKPNTLCPEDHITCETPLGQIIIEWKSWKDDPTYCIIIDGSNWIGCGNDLEECKDLAKQYLRKKLIELKQYLQ